VLLVANLLVKSLLGSQLLVAVYVRTLRTQNVQTLSIAAQIADRTRSNANLDCPTCLNIKIDIREFMRQTELEFQALRDGFMDLLSRFNVCDSNFKGRILLSQSS